MFKSSDDVIPGEIMIVGDVLQQLKNCCNISDTKLAIIKTACHLLFCGKLCVLWIIAILSNSSSPSDDNKIFYLCWIHCSLDSKHFSHSAENSNSILVYSSHGSLHSEQIVCVIYECCPLVFKVKCLQKPCGITHHTTKM